jgi:hypothetical protein
MTRWKKPKPRELRRQQRLLLAAKSFDFHNGGGCEPYDIKCESCGFVTAGGEQYNVHELQVTPCFRCGGELALYEPQLR